jgi:hypothetical protein
MSLELSLLLVVSKGGGNPFESQASSKNSKPGLEFGEARGRSNKLGQRRLSKECL